MYSLHSAYAPESFYTPTSADILIGHASRARRSCWHLLFLVGRSRVFSYRCCQPTRQKDQLHPLAPQYSSPQGRAKQKAWKRQFCGRVRVPSTLGGTGQNILASIRSHHSPPPSSPETFLWTMSPMYTTTDMKNRQTPMIKDRVGNLSRDAQISGLQGDGLRPELVIRYSQFPQIPHRRQWIIFMLVRSGALIEDEAEVLWGQSLHMQRDANGR